MIVPIVHHPGYTAQLAPGHRFPMDKFARVAALAVAEGLAPQGFHVPLPASRTVLGHAHDPGYVEAVLTGTLGREAVRRIGFELNPSVIARACLATGGTLLASRLALLHGIACNGAGGSHHASAASGAGFCVFNDVAVAAATLLAEGAVRRVLVVDCDVHHGDGTAAIFAGDSRVTTLSVHCRANWPLDPPPSDLDVALEPGTGGDLYSAALSDALDRVLAPGAWGDGRYDLAFYLAGVDVAEGDRLGRLALTPGDIAARDHQVLARLRGARMPVCTVLAGGYHPDPDHLARLHLTVFQAARAVAGGLNMA
jgi:acetoin utilization deacetylase AcuC-like enzyme